MENSLERFVISGLHGQKTIDARIKDGTLVLVGENGSGKTTFLRILFNFLSCRWLQLVQFRFEYVSATIGGIEYKVDHKTIKNSLKGLDRILLNEIPSDFPSLELFNRSGSNHTSTEKELIKMRNLIAHKNFMRHLEFFDDSPLGFKKNLQNLTSNIRNSIKSQILYLPTYRRIEREFSSIFEGVDNDEIRRRRRKSEPNQYSNSCIELVEFGMKDVQQAVDRTLEKLKEFTRENLNNLTLGYLGDVVDRKYENSAIHAPEDVSEETVRSVLNRIHESILSPSHKNRLFSVINSARSANAPTEHEKIIYHYFLKLLAFQKSLQEHERQISTFCDLCSQYIVDKKFVYDSQDYSFTITPTDEKQEPRSITLSDLSSGEKQIVSLFSHLHLSGQKKFFVLIDEPELSLSVPWQRRFLQDIRAGNLCRGLVATTHSPFIYDNNLREYAHSLGEFVSF